MIPVRDDLRALEGYHSPQVDVRVRLNPGVVFVSKGRFQDGWQGTLDHYIRDYGGDPARRGRLRFFDIKVEMLAPDAAQLISRYELDRPGAPQHGINTRLMRKVAGHWVIALNHVSAEEGS